ncbi:ornithine decarboxylase [Longimycelium tulufanense]|uniref:ornithine decarboxylase n=1 Tax=Longimycelium tulufanense TaxID=907463 RepID=A0A8J3CKZ8_9PSEU|nr:type III PLP-dependent enzyme [Longimycelium tulufanense]GGM80252.1 ornithine decarboxylase [Longimycelium tulufanense]
MATVDHRRSVGQGRTATAGVPARIRTFLDRDRPQTPCLVIDLPTVAERYADVRAALPEARVFYAVKANPAPEVVALLVRLGACFDVASPPEIDLCLAQGACPETISYSNPIKKRSDVAHAHRVGVRLFALDSTQDLEHIAAEAPGSSVFCRLLVEPAGAKTPFGRKFGCSADMAIDLLARAAELGLAPYGVSFHVGSQQTDPDAWEGGIAAAARVFRALAERGIRARFLNLGGGFPASYLEPASPLPVYGKAVRAAVERHFGGMSPELAVEPGRSIVGDAGVIRSEVVLVSRKSYDDDHRWVYLDVGRYNGMAECEGEAIAYRIVTPHDGGPVGPVVIAGPTCDGDDVLYQRTRYQLPLDLRAGDQVDILSAGAYTASYASVCFNGFPPLPTHCVSDRT